MIMMFSEKVTLVSWDDTWNTRLYTWREYDKEIWLYFLRARYYDPITWRFISKDPIGQIDDVNLYAYVGNNSVMYVDLMGLAAKNVLVVWFLWLEFMGIRFISWRSYKKLSLIYVRWNWRIK